MKNNEKKVEKLPAEGRSARVIILTVTILCFIAVFGYYISDMLREAKDKKEGEVNVPLKGEYAITSNDVSDFDLYFLKLENEANRNLVYSPLSIKYALEMLSEGAAGDTKTQIDAILGNYKAGKYTNSKNMSLANALFIRDSFKGQIQNTYIETLQSKYDAEVKYDGFNNADMINNWVKSKTFNIIEEIISDNEVKDLDFALVNALAIDMEWVNKLSGYIDIEFPHEKVGEEDIPYTDVIWPIEIDYYDGLDFENLNTIVEAIDMGATGNKYNIIKTLGEENIRKTVSEAYEEWRTNGAGVELCKSDIDCQDTKTVVNEYIETISKNYGKYQESTDFGYYVDENIKVFAKDLKKYNGTTLQYVGIMPKTEKLTKFIEGLTAEGLTNIIKSIKTASWDNMEEGYITSIYGIIPTFKYNYSLALMDDLKSLGITDAFDKDKADLSKIVNGAYITSANHSADIEFCNEGIKAAAATEIGGLGNAIGPSFDYFFEVPYKKINLTFDKPYMYLIRNKDTGEIWFVGNVYEPNHYTPLNNNEDM